MPHHLCHTARQRRVPGVGIQCSLGGNLRVAATLVLMSPTHHATRGPRFDALRQSGADIQHNVCATRGATWRGKLAATTSNLDTLSPATATFDFIARSRIFLLTAPRFYGSLLRWSKKGTDCPQLHVRREPRQGRWNGPEQKKAGETEKRCFLTKRTCPSIANTRLTNYRVLKRTQFSCHLTPNELPKQAKTALIIRKRTRILEPQHLAGRPTERGATRAAQYETITFAIYDSLPRIRCLSHFFPCNSPSAE